MLCLEILIQRVGNYKSDENFTTGSGENHMNMIQILVYNGQFKATDQELQRLRSRKRPKEC